MRLAGRWVLVKSRGFLSRARTISSGLGTLWSPILGRWRVPRSWFGWRRGIIFLQVGWMSLKRQCSGLADCVPLLTRGATMSSDVARRVRILRDEFEWLRDWFGCYAIGSDVTRRVRMVA